MRVLTILCELNAVDAEHPDDDVGGTRVISGSIRANGANLLRTPWSQVADRGNHIHSQRSEH